MTTFPESHRDLLDAQVACFATIDSQGYPQVTAVWFLLDDDGRLKISLNTVRHKVKYLTERPRCSLFLLDLENPYRYLEVRGNAVIEPDDDYAFAQKIGAKYGADVKSFDGPGERRVVVAIDPVKVHPVKMR